MKVRIVALVSLTALLIGGFASPAAAEEKPRRDVVDRELQQRVDENSSETRHAVIVTTRSGEVPAAAASERARRFDLVRGFSAHLSAEQIERLAGDPDVVRVEHDAPVRALNDGARASSGVDAVQAALPALDGAGLTAAVIDTGIDPNHADLAGKVVGWKDFVTATSTPYDNNGHGTHVAASIAGSGAASGGTHRGVAPAANLVGVKVLDGAGNGSMSNVVAALDWVVANKAAYGIRVVNLSLGASGCSSGTDSASLAVDRATSAGVIVIVAAGNEGPKRCTIGSPGAARTAITVGAMADSTAAGHSLAVFSSRGPTADGRVKPDLVAPGVSIMSAAANTGTGYKQSSGTSMATPFVAGLALLLADASPAVTPSQAKTMLTTTSIDWGAVGADHEYGHGRVDPVAALEAVGAAVPAFVHVPHRVHTGSLTSTGTSHRYNVDVDASSTPIAATLILPTVSVASTTSPNLDVRIYSPSGSLVASGNTTKRQDTAAVVPHTSGTYVVEVRSASGGTSYVLDVSAPLAPDTTAPAITSRTPAPDATGVSTTTKVSVTFSEAMAASTTLSVTDSAGSPVTGTVAWAGTTLSFTPSTALRSLSTYTARAAGTDTSGNPLPADAGWSFQTTGTWSKVRVYPTSAAVESGTLVSGSVANLNRDDGKYYRVSSPTAGTTRIAGWTASFANVPSTLRNVSLSVRAKASSSCSQTLAVLEVASGAWVQVHSRSLSTSEATSTVTLTDPARFVDATGSVTVRVRCSSSRTISSYGELVSLTYEGLA